MPRKLALPTRFHAIPGTEAAAPSLLLLMADLMQQWIAAMRADRFEEAWALSDAVLKARDPATRDDPAQPFHLRWVWDGRPVDGRHMLVRCYHGLGDTIQFARYLPLLGRRAASVTVEAQVELLPLLRDVPGIDRLIPFDPRAPQPAQDGEIEIMELGFALRVRPDAVAVPYLKAPVQRQSDARIAICYTTGGWDHERRVPPEALRRLCQRHRCRSLVPEPTTLPVVNPSGCSLAIEETAAIIASIDLVITVDTMVAHLAGALGTPAWVLLKAEPDWRWTDGPVSRWYPSSRLHVQPRPGDWASVIAAVERDLLAWERSSADLLVQRHQPEAAAA